MRLRGVREGLTSLTGCGVVCEAAGVEGSGRVRKRRQHLRSGRFCRVSERGLRDESRGEKEDNGRKDMRDAETRRRCDQKKIPLEKNSRSRISRKKEAANT